MPFQFTESGRARRVRTPKCSHPKLPRITLPTLPWHCGYKFAAVPGATAVSHAKSFFVIAVAIVTKPYWCTVRGCLALHTGRNNRLFDCSSNHWWSLVRDVNLDEAGGSICKILSFYTEYKLEKIWKTNSTEHVDIKNGLELLKRSSQTYFRCIFVSIGQCHASGAKMVKYAWYYLKSLQILLSGCYHWFRFWHISHRYAWERVDWPQFRSGGPKNQ